MPFGDDIGMGIVYTLRDQFSDNARLIERSFNKLESTTDQQTKAMEGHLQRLKAGLVIAGIGAAMTALPAALAASTVETQKAIGTLQANGVETIGVYKRMALQISSTLGGISQAAFLEAAAPLKGGLSMLQDETIASVTALSARMAAATQADVTGTSQMLNTAFAAFRQLPEFNDLMRQAGGNAEKAEELFFERVAGGIVKAQEIFNTNGPKMVEAMQTIGAQASVLGFSFSEQVATLGVLQRALPGGEAATQFASFLRSAKRGMDELGLAAEDETGKLRHVADIVEAIQEKFGLRAGQAIPAAVGREIQLAFGRAEAVQLVAALIGHTDELRKGIAAVGETSATSGASMALLERFLGHVNEKIGAQANIFKQNASNAMQALGEAMLPVLIPILQGMAWFLRLVTDVATAHPVLTRVILASVFAMGLMLTVIGLLVAGFAVLGIATTALAATMGVAQVGLAPLIATFLGIAAIVVLVVGVLAGLAAGFVWLVSKVVQGSRALYQFVMTMTPVGTLVHWIGAKLMELGTAITKAAHAWVIDPVSGWVDGVKERMSHLVDWLKARYFDLMGLVPERFWTPEMVAARNDLAVRMGAGAASGAGEAQRAALAQPGPAATAVAASAGLSRAAGGGAARIENRVKVEPGNVTINLDGRKIAEAMARWQDREEDRSAF